MDMAEYILSILRTQMIILWTWGFHNPAAIENGLQFNVQGFIFSGIVKVIYDEGTDTFIVRTENPDGSTRTETTDVYLDCLVNVIDGLVEKDCSQTEYAEKVNAEYGWK